MVAAVLSITRLLASRGNVARLMNTGGQLNLVLGWLWIALGFASGAVLGLWFHKEQWLGGYASWMRRLYRLGHISFFGLDC